jgi:hypothetical protein
MRTEIYESEQAMTGIGLTACAISLVMDDLRGLHDVGSLADQLQFPPSKESFMEACYGAL